MHNIKYSASPYIYDIELDVNYEVSTKDVTIFKDTISQCLKVYGYTPNVRIIAKSKYQHWSTVKLLAEAMLTGRLAICTDDEINNIIEDLSSSLKSIKVRLFKISEQAECQNWSES